jgi:predicted secreted Zn-dependent protease
MGWCSSAFAGSTPAPEILQTAAYYHVNGRTVAQIRSQMHEAGPLDLDGRHNDASTSWYVTWTYPFNREAHGCTTGPVNVTVRIMFQLPRWKRPPDAAEDVVQRWGAFSSALQLHEDGHKQIVIGAARRLAALLPAIAPQSSCEDVRLRADGEGQRILAEMRSKSAEYDRVTDHGFTQGARLE